MSRLSAVIITRNEEAVLPRCLKSVSWADEIIMIDSHSTDKTREIAAQLGAKVVVSDWRGFGPAKQEGVNMATGEWVLSIDADEEVSPELRAEIQQVLADGTSMRGFEIPRKTNFLGRWIYHCGWYPDYVLRLFLKTNGRFDEAVVHEKVLVDGPVGKLKSELLHYSFPTLEHYFTKSNRYTTLGAHEALRAGKTSTWFGIIFKPPVSFFSQYILRQGFRDGVEGFLVSALSAVAVMVKYAKLRRLVQEQQGMKDNT